VSVVCISDTHNNQPTLPDGDVLIHAGDLTNSGTFEELQSALSWLSAQPHAVKVVIAGNHDLLLDPDQDDRDRKGPGQTAADQRAMLNWGDIVYLQNSEATVTCPNGRCLRIYGSPASASSGNWAFQYLRSKDIWGGTLPDDGLDILVTHGPPRGHLDLLKVGCPFLLDELWRVRPRLHVFGHVHEGAGTEWLLFDGLQAAYERTVVAGGGLWNLVRTAAVFVRSLFRSPKEAKSLLANAAIVGGLRNDKRREPVKVTI